jgi:hypothetical protein
MSLYAFQKIHKSASVTIAKNVNLQEIQLTAKPITQVQIYVILNMVLLAKIMHLDGT